MKLLAFAASSSSTSINKKFATYAANLLDNVSVEVVDLNDYQLPLFSQDQEAEMGQPELAKNFIAKIENSDAIIISFAEHNGSYSAAYKNLFDWCSRINPKVYQDKPMVLLATSPGSGGGSNVLAAATQSMPFFGATVKGSFSLPSFYDNFDMQTNTLSDTTLIRKLTEQVNQLTI